MKNLHALFLLSLFPLFAGAQNPDIKRTYHWYFGEKAGLDFSSGSPVPIVNSAMTAEEGCASISDTCGELLFYTDGDTVWNKNNQPMPNGTGLMGCGSSTQSSLIVPQPGNDSIYYIFTTDCIENNGTSGLRYSVVNINMSGGYGSVIQTNILLYAPSSEKLAATYHANGTDIWILSVNRYPPGPPPDTTMQYYAYLLTASGININPIISPSSIKPHKGYYTYLTFSHQGNKIINNWQVGSLGADSLEIFDFNKNTGALSNLIRIHQDSLEGVYGLVFSSDDSKLYASVYNVFSSIPSENYYKIVQYDLSSNDSATIVASRTLVHLSDSTNPNGTAYFGMQTASDGKIYIATALSVSPWFPDSIDVIANPNATGLTCNYVVNGVYLGNGNSMQGLPNFVNSYFGGFWQPPCNVGIEENIISDGIIIYPNPFSSSATIRIYEELRTKNAELRVYDILGREFLNMKLETENTKLERGNLSSGIYFLKVQVKNKIFTQKLIIANH